MNTNSDSKRRLTLALKRAGIASALAIVLATVPVAFAGGGHKHGGKHGRGHGHHDSYHSNHRGNHRGNHHDSWHGGRNDGHHRYVAIPRTVYRGGWSAPYYQNSVYFAPHHHRHSVYRYPVWIDGAVVYRPYAYCGTQLFVGAAVPLPQIAIGFSFGNAAPGPYAPYGGAYVYEPPY